MTIKLKVSFVVAHYQKNITAWERGHSLTNKKKQSIALLKDCMYQILKLG